jgi:hypothetical protein
VASSRPLFFLAVFVLLDGDGFILQVHGVFTRIRSGATLAALGGGALRSTAAAACADLFEMVLTVKIRQPSHEFTFGVGMTFVSYSLVLTPVV